MNTRFHTTHSIAALIATLVSGVLTPAPALARGSTGAEAEIRALRAELARTRAETQAELQSLRNELAATRAETKQEVQQNTQQIQETKQTTDRQVEELHEHLTSHHDLIFFRGGYAQATHARDYELFLNNPLLNSVEARNSGQGWYIGAGFDHRLTDDIWGLWDGAAMDGEVMFSYMNFGTTYSALVGNYTDGAIQVKNQVAQFVLTASPKIKFNQFGDLRPWIIPVGLAINVVSPPSSGVTYVNPGVMLGTGLEYRLWESVWAGLDFRYQFTGDDINYAGKTADGLKPLKGTSTDGLMVGGYLGFGF